MSYTPHQNQLSPPPAYIEAAPAAMESEMYIEGTLYVDGIPVSQREKKRQPGKQTQFQENQCKKLISFVRSNF